MFYVYVIESVNLGNLYIGYTNDLKRRFREHNSKLNQSTRPYAPWKLIYYEACANQKDAERREGYFKNSQGRRALKIRLKEYFKHKNLK